MSKFDDLKVKHKELTTEYFRLMEQGPTSSSNKKLDELEIAMDHINRDIEFENKKFRFSANYFNNLSMNESRELQKFSFAKFLREASSGVLTGLEMESHQEGALEMRRIGGEGAKGFCISEKVLLATNVRASTGQNITTPADGGNLAHTMPVMYFEALANALVLPSLGATFLPGLNGYLPIVRGSLFNAEWLPEGGGATIVKADFGKILMQAKRVCAIGAFSKQLLIQTSLGVENLILNGLVNANAQAILTAIINGLAANNQPVGILTTPGITILPGGVNGVSPDWAQLVALETAVAMANADIGSLGYLTNAKVRGKLKNTLKSVGAPAYCWEGSEVNGYKAAVTNAVPSNLTKGTSVGNCSAIIFGNWKDLLIGSWGGLDIVVDSYTLAEKSELRILVNSFVDAAIANPASFSMMKDALTV